MKLSKKTQIVLNLVTVAFFIGIHALFLFVLNDNEIILSEGLLKIIALFIVPLYLSIMISMFLWTEDTDNARIGYILSVILLIFAFLFLEVDSGSGVKEWMPYLYYTYIGAAMLSGIFFLYSYLFIAKSYGYKKPFIFFYIVPLVTALLVLFSPYAVINWFGGSSEIVPWIYFAVGLVIIVFMVLGFWLWLSVGSSSSSSSYGTSGSSRGSGKQFSENDVWHMLYGLSAGDSTVRGRVTDVNVRGEYSSQRLNTNFDITIDIEVTLRPNSYNTVEGLRKMANNVVSSIFSQAERKLRSNGVGYSLTTNVNVQE
ncbi:MAG: hypothetical protein IJQ23_04255 [Clostridia bacterium]|nr:hypothetical protein [Clostridia bacterium]